MSSIKTLDRWPKIWFAFVGKRGIIQDIEATFPLFDYRIVVLFGLCQVHLETFSFISYKNVTHMLAISNSECPGFYLH